VSGLLASTTGGFIDTASAKPGQNRIPSVTTPPSAR
jgi:hypothetical protein